MAYKNKIGSRRHTRLPLPNPRYWNHNTTSWTLPEPHWILQKQSILSSSCPFNLKKQIGTDWKWLSLWYTLTSYQADKRPRSKKQPGKYLEFTTNALTHWKWLEGFLRRNRVAKALIRMWTHHTHHSASTGKDWSQDMAPSYTVPEVLDITLPCHIL